LKFSFSFVVLIVRKEEKNRLIKKVGSFSDFENKK